MKVGDRVEVTVHISLATRRAQIGDAHAFRHRASWSLYPING